MYEAQTATAIRKLIQVIEDVCSGLELKNFTVARGFRRRWWEDEYGFDVKCGDKPILWFGIWQSYWERHGIPLCFGVYDGGWDARVCAEFKRLYPACVRFSDENQQPFLVSNIEGSLLLSDDPMAIILSELEGSLRKLCNQITSTGTTEEGQESLGSTGSMGPREGCGAADQVEGRMLDDHQLRPSDPRASEA
jgi:hypothetical protein